MVKIINNLINDLQTVIKMESKQNKEIPFMEQVLNNLLSDFCVNCLFCIAPNYRNKISKANSYHAKNFANDVVWAEGMNPEFETKWVRKISEKFIDRFGTIEIDLVSFENRV